MWSLRSSHRASLLWADYYRETDAGNVHRFAGVLYSCVMTDVKEELQNASILHQIGTDGMKGLRT